jgi:hypothetical protein
MEAINELELGHWVVLWLLAILAGGLAAELWSITERYRDSLLDLIVDFIFKIWEKYNVRS